MKLTINFINLKDKINSYNLKTKEAIAEILRQNAEITTNKEIEKTALLDLQYKNKNCKNAWMDFFKYELILEF